MNETFLEFEWETWSAYEWSAFLDEKGMRVVVPSRGLATLESPTGVELAWQRLELNGKGSGPVLRPVMRSARVRYRPMAREHATLFRTFGELDYRDREAIRGFAMEYGMLGVESKANPGESHLCWAREICLMREALDLAQPRTAVTEAKDRAIWAEYDSQMRAFFREQGRDDD